MTGGGQRQGRTERPTLAELQQAFQAAVLGTEDAVLSHLRAGARAGRETLFGVYRSAYAGRLVGVLRSEYPHLAAYLGDGAFDRMARGYITAHPSQHPNARWVGNRLPEYLADECVPRAHPEFAELAALERALANAFDASDSPLLTLQDLADVPPERWSDLAFRPHPSAARLDEAHNTLAIWSALKEDATPPPPCREADIVHLLVWRRDGRATVALPGDVFSPPAFSVQMSSSTRFRSPSRALLVITPRQMMSWPGKSIARYWQLNFLISPFSPIHSYSIWPRKAFLKAPWTMMPGRPLAAAKSLS